MCTVGNGSEPRAVVWLGKAGRDKLEDGRMHEVSV